jgi:hypothetical protein
VKRRTRYRTVGTRFPDMSRRKASDREAVTLEVMNPRGELPRRSVVLPTARLDDLSGKKIGIYWNGKAGADNLLDVVAELLKDKFPSSVILRYDGPLDAGDERATAICREVDTVIYGVGD